jgi:hypothetical protein
MQITNSFNLQIEESMTSEQSQHVIKETCTRGDFILATAIEINGELNLSFSGIAGDRCDSGHGVAAGYLEYIASTLVDVDCV